ncbi:hypothetical protein BOTBODRAFT_102682 [Botryobasidium botryosum FD-172 SS1]|uniref:Uncharacterized protein n=1 Tax=Botryobasidium botryosum (strain FD-172 SS1) TaxID=930990 RepID=A0A067MX50_BOTB1|nr:hypothetical protein BOTBODRAFT_102682 [Botryobasidium botryosum FD-172 SS1]
MDEVSYVARAAVAALSALGYDSCLVGGYACRLYGNSRTPEDVDIVVLNAHCSQEVIKARLVVQDSDFYLVPSKKLFATYKVLWYRLSPYKSCKVDLLQPGIMNIPDISTIHIRHIAGLPLMPFSIVLLLKLQAWTDHQIATESHLRMKQYTDSADIDRLLPLACGRNMKPCEEAYIPESFISAAKDRVRQYVTRFPTSAEHWRALGFDVPVPAPQPSIRVRVSRPAASVQATTAALSRLSVKESAQSSTKASASKGGARVLAVGAQGTKTASSSSGTPTTTKPAASVQAQMRKTRPRLKKPATAGGSPTKPTTAQKSPVVRTTSQGGNKTPTAGRLRELLQQGLLYE